MVPDFCFWIYRYLYFHHIINTPDGVLTNGMIWKAYTTGLRFDSVAFGLRNVNSCDCSIGRCFHQGMKVIFLKYIDLFSVPHHIVFVIRFILIVDYYYYEYFSPTLISLIFGFFPTGAVMHSVWRIIPSALSSGLIATIFLFPLGLKDFSCFSAKSKRGFQQLLQELWV